MRRRLTVVDGPLAFGMRRFDAARANDVGLEVLHETDRDPVRTEEALLPAYDLERELDFHYRSVRVAHLDYHLLALRAVHAHRVPGYTS
jgi:hypothetical protein